MKDSQYYGGSRLAADDSQALFKLREQAIRNGYKVRREGRRVIITPNPDPRTEQAEAPEVTP